MIKISCFNMKRVSTIADDFSRSSLCGTRGIHGMHLCVPEMLANVQRDRKRKSFEERFFMHDGNILNEQCQNLYFMENCCWTKLMFNWQTRAIYDLSASGILLMWQYGTKVNSHLRVLFLKLLLFCYFRSWTETILTRYKN